MSIDRRDFLKTVGTASLAGALAGVCGNAAATIKLPMGPDAFDFADNKVPMNAANLCPMPRLVSKTVADLQHALDVDMSGPSRNGVEAIKEDARDQVAALLGVEPDTVAFVRNTSEANNVIVQGLPLDSGDEVLLWDQNHPTNSVAWKVRAERSGCSVRYLSVPANAGSVDEVVSIFANAIGPKTKVLSFTHISNTSGFRLPLADICEAARRKQDLHIHVDGAQTWGAVDIDLTAIGCDTFTGSSHKWFMGPREVGLLYANARSVQRIWPLVVGASWGSDAQTSVIGARKFETLGQRDDAAVAGMYTAAAVHENNSASGIEKQSTAIADYLRDKLRAEGLPFASPMDPQFTSSIVILRAEPGNARQLSANVLRDGGIVTAATGGFRMSPHVYNTREHIDRVAHAVKQSRHLLSPG